MRLAELAHHLALHVAASQHAGRALGGANLEPQVPQDAREREDVALVAIIHRDEHLAALRRGKLVADRELRLSVCFGVALRDAHHLARRLHLRAEHHVGAREAAPWHHCLLHAEPVEPPIVGRQVQVGDLLPRHDARRALGERNTRGLRDERHRSARARVCLDHIDLLALDGILHVHQAAHAKRHGNARRGIAQLRHERVGEAKGRNARGGIARMDTGLLDMLQDAADIDLVPVAERVHVAFHSALEESVEVDWVVRRDPRGLGHVLPQVLRVVGDHHAAATQHVARAHEQREPDPRRNLLRLLEAPRLARRRIHDAHAVQQGTESLAVLGKVDGVGLRAHDLHAGIGERAGQLERGLAAERHHHAVGALHINDVHDVLVGKRLEVQPVGRVVVGGDGFGVAVHHDGLEAAARQRVARVHAAVVELDALANTVGPRAQNHHLGLARAGHLVCRNATARVGRYPHEALVGLVVILR